MCTSGDTRAANGTQTKYFSVLGAALLPKLTSKVSPCTFLLVITAFLIFLCILLELYAFSCKVRCDEHCKKYMHGRGQAREKEGLFVWRKKEVWLPSHSADYRWRGLCGVVLQVPAASVVCVLNALSSPLQPAAPWPSHSHTYTQQGREGERERENNNPLAIFISLILSCRCHTVASKQYQILLRSFPSLCSKCKAICGRQKPSGTMLIIAHYCSLYMQAYLM